MEDEDALDDLVDFHFEFSVHHQDCENDYVLTGDELDRVWWRNRLNADISGWNALSCYYDEFIKFGEEVIEKYYNDGYDEDGLDRLGYNREGLHHMPVKAQWQLAIDHTCVDASQGTSLNSLKRYPFIYLGFEGSINLFVEN